MNIRVDQAPFHSDYGARQRAWVSVVLEKCYETKDKSLEAKNGSRLSPPVEEIQNKILLMERKTYFEMTLRLIKS